MQKKNYRDRYYSGKIRSLVFFTVMYELLILLMLLVFSGIEEVFSGVEEVIELGTFGADLVVFGCMGALLSIMLHKINKVRFKRTEDALRKQRALPEDQRDSFFLTSRTDSTIGLMILMSIFYLYIMGMFVDTGFSGAFYMVVAASFVFMIVIECAYNHKLKNLCKEGTSIDTKDNTIFWEEEINKTARNGIIQLAWGVGMFVYFIIQTSLTTLGVVVILSGLLSVFIFTILRAINLSRMADEEAIENWTAKQKKEQEETLAREKKEENSSKKEEEPAEFIVQSGAMPLYKDSASFDALCKEFVEFAKECNLQVLPEEARMIFAGMAASRAIWLCCENTIYAKSVAKVLQSFFTDFEGMINVPFTVNSVSGLFQNVTYGAGWPEANLKDRLCIVKQRANSVNVLAFDMTVGRDFDTVFAPFITTFRAPQLKNFISARDIYGYQPSGAGLQGLGLHLQPNMWCVFTAKTIKELPKKSFEYASAIQLKGNVQQETPFILKKKQRVLPYARFKELVMESAQDYFLALDIWKKIDRIEEYLQSVTDFSITNPWARQLETYSSVLLSCEMPVMEVVDDLLANKIFPVISHLNKEQLNQDGNSFAELLDGLFGMDNIPLCQKKLSDNNWA